MANNIFDSVAKFNKWASTKINSIFFLNIDFPADF